MKRKDFQSSDRKEIEEELLRLMRDPRCYALSTFGARPGSAWCRVRLIQRHSKRLWVSEYELYNIRRHGLPDRSMKSSCFSVNDDFRLTPTFAEHIAFTQPLTPRVSRQ